MKLFEGVPTRSFIKTHINMLYPIKFDYPGLKIVCPQRFCSTFLFICLFVSKKIEIDFFPADFSGNKCRVVDDNIDNKNNTITVTLIMPMTTTMMMTCAMMIVVKKMNSSWRY